MTSPAEDSTRRDAIARGLSARMLDERLDLEDLKAIDTIVGQLVERTIDVDGFTLDVLKFHRRYRIVESGCWEWTGFYTGKYGAFRIGGKGGRDIRAHRLSWVIQNGPIPPGMFICHQCDNPRCVNPDHLFVGTPQDNVDDMHAKGRRRTGRIYRGHSNARAKLTAQQVREILASPGSHVDVARKYGVEPRLISRIRRGLAYVEVPRG
jgi:hypothetical protein